MWDKDTVHRYEEWFDTQEGAFALRAERRLIEYLMSGWPRRGHSILDVGCGPGLMLEMFYEAGLDVTGLDASPAMLAAARRRMGLRADLHVGNAEELPFEDNEFDFVSLLTVLEFVENPARVLEEACRVAARGVLITQLNKWSFYYLTHGVRCCGRHRGILREANWMTPITLRKMARKASGCRPYSMRSVMPGPVSTWKDTIPWKWINSSLLPYGLGSYAGLRLDIGDIVPVTPILAPVAPAPRKPVASP